MADLRVLILVALTAASVSGQACTTGLTRQITPGTPIIFQHPGYPNNFATGLSCTWTLQAPTGYRIKVECPDFKVTTSPDCSQDVLTLNGKKYCTGPSIKSITYNKKTVPVTFKSATATGKWTCNATAVEYPCNCGNIKTTPSDKYPHVAMLKNAAGVFCGATIISERYALSSTYCVMGRTASNVKLVVGRHNEKVTTEYDVASMVSQASKNFLEEKMYMNDLALVKTVNPIRFSDDVGIACLPFRYVDDEVWVMQDKEVQVVGTGPEDLAALTGLRNVSPLKLKVLAQATCHEKYPKTYRSQFCTYSYPKNACQYHPGTNVMYQEPADQRFYSVGIVSGVKLCGSTTYGLNTRVVHSLLWVKANAKESRFCNDTTI